MGTLSLMGSNEEAKRDAAINLLINLCSEHGVWARHQETQRSTASRLLITIAVLLVGLITYDKKITFSDLPLSLFISFIGMFGVLLVYKYYIQFKFHDNRIDFYKKSLDSFVDNIDLKAIENDADNLTKDRFWLFAWFNLYKSWMMFHFLIVVAGVILSTIAFFD